MQYGNIVVYKYLHLQLDWKINCYKCYLVKEQTISLYEISTFLMQEFRTSLAELM